MARGKHLFPFRTEQLSPSAPMVLGPQGPGRVGRRRFTLMSRPSGRLVVVDGRFTRRSSGRVVLGGRGSGAATAGGCPARRRGNRAWGLAPPGRAQASQSPTVLRRIAALARVAPCALGAYGRRRAHRRLARARRASQGARPELGRLAACTALHDRASRVSS
jgi:hypothetical protein